MERFLRLYGNVLLWVYHCFDRVVINGYLVHLQRANSVAYFFREVKGVKCITKELLAERTLAYGKWVERRAENLGVPMTWAEKGVRKEDAVLPHQERMIRHNRFGLYFIYMSKEQGATFRISRPRYPTKDPNWTILRPMRSCYTHYYFYIRDEVLGPMVMRVATFLPFNATYYLNGHSFIERELTKAGVGFRKHDNAFLAVDDPAALQEAAGRFTAEVIRKRLDYWTIALGPKFSAHERSAMNLERRYSLAQVEYCRNFIFRSTFPIRKLFTRSCELGIWTMTADKLKNILGQRVNRKLRGKLQTVLEKMDHGFYVFRAHMRNSFVKQYEKFCTFLRNEVCSNNLQDFKLKKGLENLEQVRKVFTAVTDRFAAFQAETFNVHQDFPLFQRLALPMLRGNFRLPGIKIHDTRLIRVMEVLMHSGGSLTLWRTRTLHDAIIKTFSLDPARYTITQLRYDVRKLMGHELVEKEPRRHAYRLTDKGRRVSLLFVLFHKRICGPLAGSLFLRRPAPTDRPPVPIEQAYNKADEAIDIIMQLLAA